MANLLTFTLKLKDLMSSPLMKAGNVGNSVFNKLAAGQDKFNKRTGLLSNNITGLRAKLDQLTKTRDLSLNLGDIKKANSEIQRVERQLDKLENSGKGKSGSGMLSGAGGLIAGGLAGLGAFEVGKGILTAGTDMEQTRIQFKTFMGDLEKGNAMIAQLQKFSLATPFDDAQVLTAGKSLLAFGVQANQMESTLTKIGNISSATGKDFNELATIYGKAKIAGTLYAEDINQLVEAGIPIMDLFAKQLGVGVDQVKKMASEGKLTFDMFDKSFDQLGGATGRWGSLMQEQSETVAGRWSSLAGSAQNFASSLGESLLPLMARMVDDGNNLLAFVKEYKTELGTMAETLAIGALAYGALTLGTDLWAIATGKMTLAQWGLNMAMLANPVFWVAAGIAAIAGSVIYCWKKFEGFRGFLFGLWESVKTIFSAIGNVIHGALTFDPALIAKGLSQATQIGENYAKGFKAGVKDFQKDNGMLTSFQGATGKMLDQNGKPINLPFGQNPFAANSKNIIDLASSGSNKSGGASKSTLKDGIGQVTGGNGGNKVTHISIKFDNLIKDGVHITSANLKEGADQIKNMITEAIVGALNDANVIAG